MCSAAATVGAVTDTDQWPMQVLPVAVSGLSSGVTSISAGTATTCAVVNGAAKCWGANSTGNVGDGTQFRTAVPVQVSGLTSGVQSISTADFHSCAMMSNGTVKCWGLDEHGQLGNEADDSVCFAGTELEAPCSLTPINVENFTGLTATKVIAGGYGGSAHSCAILSTGQLRCWGVNTYNELGNNSGTHYFNSSTQCADGNCKAVQPVVAQDANSATLTGVTDVAGNDHSTCVVVGGALKCWGVHGLGGAHTVSGAGTSQTLKQIPGLESGVSKITLGGISAGEVFCALLTAGSVKCWGYSYMSANGATAEVNTPTVVAGLESGVTAVSLGVTHGCAVMSDGTARCWGDNQCGELGNATTPNSASSICTGGYCSTTTATPVLGPSGSVLTGVTAISTGDYHTCAIVNGAAYCWGINTHGQLGTGELREESGAP